VVARRAAMVVPAVGALVTLRVEVRVEVGSLVVEGMEETVGEAVAPMDAARVAAVPVAQWAAVVEAMKVMALRVVVEKVVVEATATVVVGSELVAAGKVAGAETVADSADERAAEGLDGAAMAEAKAVMELGARMAVRVAIQVEGWTALVEAVAAMWRWTRGRVAAE